MKSMLNSILVMVLLLVTIGNVKGQKKKSKKEIRAEKFIETQKILDEGMFEFDVERAFPQGGRSIDLTNNPGFVRVKDGNAEGDLPFFGRAYRVDYGGDAGINFEGKVEELKSVKNDKKQRVTYSFKVKDKDVYNITMEVGYDGSGSLSVTSNDRSFISYHGKVSEIINEEE
ncbi:DUF4251 domain-containing protein [Marinilabiliaceae bacterium JC017]|nr:DUF4251 domain-containing protein [Marinilabiliaceae bacterium JC017]